MHIVLIHMGLDTSLSDRLIESFLLTNTATQRQLENAQKGFIASCARMPNIVFT